MTSASHIDIQTNVLFLAPLRRVPWYNIEELYTVASMVDKTLHEICIQLLKNDSIHIDIFQITRQKLMEWSIRGSLPQPVEATIEFFDILLHEFSIISTSKTSIKKNYTEKDFDTEINLFKQKNNRTTRLAISCAIVRFVNSLTDSGQVREYAMSVLSLATKLQLPRILVDIRHDTTHGQLPTYSSLVNAFHASLEWLRTYYWNPQAKQALQNAPWLAWKPRQASIEQKENGFVLWKQMIKNSDNISNNTKYKTDTFMNFLSLLHKPSCTRCNTHSFWSQEYSSESLFIIFCDVEWSNCMIDTKNKPSNKFTSLVYSLTYTWLLSCSSHLNTILLPIFSFKSSESDSINNNSQEQQKSDREDEKIGNKRLRNHTEKKNIVTGQMQPPPFHIVLPMVISMIRQSVQVILEHLSLDTNLEVAIFSTSPVLLLVTSLSRILLTAYSQNNTLNSYILRACFATAILRTLPNFSKSYSHVIAFVLASAIILCDEKIVPDSFLLTIPTNKYGHHPALTNENFINENICCFPEYTKELILQYIVAFKNDSKDNLLSSLFQPLQHYKNDSLEQYHRISITTVDTDIIQSLSDLRSHLSDKISIEEMEKEKKFHVLFDELLCTIFKSYTVSNIKSPTISTAEPITTLFSLEEVEKLLN